MPPIAKTCKVCGDQFTRKARQGRTNWEKQESCSRGCALAYNKTERYAKVSQGLSRAWREGKRKPYTVTPEIRERISVAQKKRFSVDKPWNTGLFGEQSHSWKGADSRSLKTRAMYAQVRRQRKRAAGDGFTVEEWRGLKSSLLNMCVCCKRTEPEISLTVDHIIPIFYGGKNDISNIQPLCLSCNSRKRVKALDFLKGVSYQFLT